MPPNIQQVQTAGREEPPARASLLPVFAAAVVVLFSYFVWDVLGPLAVLALPIGLAILATLPRYPELALALFYNGQAYYFYSMFRLGLKPQTAITGGWNVLLALSAILGLRRYREGSFRLILPDILLALLMIWCVFSAKFISSPAGWAWEKIAGAPVFVVAAYLAGRLLNNTETFDRFTNTILTATKILGVVFGLELIVNYSSQVRFGLYSFNDDPSSSTDNPILISVTFAIPVLLLGIRFLEGKFKATSVNVFWTLGLLYLSLRAGGRGGILSLLIGFMFYFFTRRLRLRDLLILTAFGVSLFSLFILLPPELTLRYEGGGSDLHNTVLQRLYLWQLMWEYFLSSPWIGWGFGNFVHTTPYIAPVGTGLYAHNIFLEVAAELGIAGLAILVSLLALTFIRSLPKLFDTRTAPDDRTALRTALALFVYALAGAQTSGHLTNQVYLFLTLGIVWGLLSALRKGTREQGNEVMR
jgi:O-antigen ligase